VSGLVPSDRIDEASANEDHGRPAFSRRYGPTMADERVAKLLWLLDELCELLRRQGDDHWADWIGKDAEWLRRGDGYGLVHFRRAFGGSGSLSDVYFHPANGNAESEDEGRRLNTRFSRSSRARPSSSRTG
jgi:hypothetical protein